MKKTNKLLPIEQKVGNKIVIFKSTTSELITLNETASFVYELLKKQFSSEEIKDRLIKKYQIDEKTAIEDIRQLINQFKKQKILPVA